MDVNFDDGQLELGRIARQLFESRCPLATVRELEHDELGYQPEVWQELAGLDWISLAWPEALGGSGGTLVDLVVIYRELGRALVPNPHLACAVIAGEALVREATPRTELLAAMAAGRSIVAPAIYDPDTVFGPEGVTLPIIPTTDGYRLSGEKVLVPYAHVADRLLVAGRTTAPPDGTTLVLVDPSDPAVVVERMANIGDIPLCSVTFDHLEVAPDAVVGPVGQGWSLLGPALERAAVLRCAEVVGAGGRLLEMSVDYALGRQQFGRPIGQFQAVQYLCTDIAIATHLSDLLTRQAAWRLDRGLPARREVALAKSYGSRAAQTVVERAHAVFAGVAFMVESDVQLYTRRAKHWELDLGEARFYDEVIASGLEL